MKTLSHVEIRPGATMLNGELISTAGIAGLYREFAGDYPKFHKMDMLCKLGFMGAELLLRGMSAEEKENGAVMLFNRNGSLVTDRNYTRTIADGNYFPSPALFVYTLANIVTGEIAIRHRMYGESSFHVMEEPDRQEMERIVSEAWLTSDPAFILAGWVDYNDDEDYLAELSIVIK